MAESTLEATGRDLAKTLIKRAYFDASNALALTEAERNELRAKAISLQGLGEVEEIVSRNPADVAKARKEYERIHVLMMERCEFVAGQGTAAMQKERAVALQKASEWRQGAELAKRRGEHDLAYERRNAAEHFEHLVDCLERKLYPPKLPPLPLSYPPVATQSAPRITVRPPASTPSIPVPVTLTVMPRQCAFIRNLDDALTVSKTLVPGNNYAMHGVKGAIMGRRPFMPSMQLARSRMPMSKSLRLGQYQDPAAAEVAILALIPTMPLADAFVKYTLDSKPDYIPSTVAGMAVGEYLVKRALLFFERNYAAKQNVRRAASWGVRFPEDLRADLAYSRADMSDEYDELFGFLDVYVGSYNGEIGGFSSASPEDKAAEAALGPTPTIITDPDAGNFFYIVSLKTATQDLFHWFAHVYRSLQIFVPVLAKMAVNADIEPADIYGALQLPVADAPKFILWTVAANTFMFERLNSQKALRGLLDDAMLNDVLLGFNDAARIYGAEAYFLKKKGLEIKAEISWLAAAEFITKILALPVTIIQNLPSLGTLPWYAWAGIAAGALVVVGGTIYVLNRI